MKEKNRIIWLSTIEFLSVFNNIHYDNVPINLPLLRDFQNYVQHHYKSAIKWKKNTVLEKHVHTACEPYLIKEQPIVQNEGKLLVRSNLYPLTRNFKNHQCIYLAHHKKEYREALKNKGCTPLLYLPHLLETKIKGQEEKRVQSKLNKIFKSRTTPLFFRTKSFIIWMKNITRHLLIKIRKVHTLFKKYSFTKILYGSTINCHGALITTFAQSRKINTANFQHGLLGELGHLPVNAHVNFVWGESHRDYLVSFGAPSSRFKIVPPVFIRSNTSTPLPFSDNQKIRSLQKSQPIKILVALQPLGLRYNRKMIKNIEKAANKFKGELFIYYKLHPDQQRKNYKDLIDSAHASLYSHGETTLQNLLHWCNLIITPYSTVAYEGILYKKPVFFYGSPKRIYYLKGSPKFIRSESDIALLFFRSIKNPTFLSTLSKQLPLKDKAANMSLNLLEIENNL